MYLKWFLLLVKESKLASKILSTNILDSKLVWISLLETNLEYKILVVKTLVANG